MPCINGECQIVDGEPKCICPTGTTGKLCDVVSNFLINFLKIFSILMNFLNWFWPGGATVVYFRFKLGSLGKSLCIDVAHLSCLGAKMLCNLKLMKFSRNCLVDDKQFFFFLMCVCVCV